MDNQKNNKNTPQNDLDNSKNISKNQKDEVNNETTDSSSDESDKSFFDYASIADLLHINEINFPANPIRFAELDVLSSICAQPINNNALIIVDKAEDALPTLSLLENVTRQINPNLSLAPVHIAYFDQGGSDVVDFDELEKSKSLLNDFITQIDEGRFFPVLMDVVDFLDDINLENEVDYLLSQEKPVIAIVTKKQLSYLDKLIDEERQYSKSFAKTGVIIKKSPLLSFSRMEISPLSFEESKAVMAHYLELRFNNGKDNTAFEPDSIEHLLKRGYETFSSTDNLTEIEQTIRLLSLGYHGDKPVSVSEIDAFFDAIEIQNKKASIDKCEQLLNQKVLGQEEAIHQVAEAILAKEYALTDEKQPTVLGFFGPSGVGKTETAETLGPIVSGQESVLINMSEYQEPHSIAKLISSPPGYVGSDKPGLLYETVAKNPKTVLILDEFEKADPSVHRLFLGVFDKGIAHDSCKGDVDLSQTTIILTSNAGISESAGLGFGENSGKISYYADEKSIEQAFAPEFMGRIQKQIIFKPLSDETLSKIVDLILAPAQKKLSEKFNVQLELSESTRAKLVAEASNPRYGARPLKNLIRTKILTPLSMQLNSNKLPQRSTVIVDFDKEMQNYLFTPKTSVKHIQNQTTIPPVDYQKTRD